MTTNLSILVEEQDLMKSSQWKKFVSLGLSVFALSIGSIGLTGCEVEPEGEAEELGEDIDEGVEDLEEGKDE